MKNFLWIPAARWRRIKFIKTGKQIVKLIQRFNNFTI